MQPFAYVAYTAKGQKKSGTLVAESERAAFEALKAQGLMASDITAKAVDVADGGQVDGTVSADNVSIKGRQSGSVKCKELALGSSSEVKSKVTAQTMMSEKGARLVGEVQISGG